MAAAAQQQACDQAGKAALVGMEFISVAPAPAFRPAPRENNWMGERLIEAFPPALAAGIEPELNADWAVAHQEGVRWGQQDGVAFFIFPAVQVLGGQNAILNHLQVGLSERGSLCLQAGCCHTAEFLHRFDQPGGDGCGIVTGMKAKAGLR